jgi:hypothetical protein
MVMMSLGFLTWALPNFEGESRPSTKAKSSAAFCALPEKRRKAPAFRHGDISRDLAVAFCS